MSAPRNLRRRQAQRPRNRLSRRHFLMSMPAAGLIATGCGGGSGPQQTLAMGTVANEGAETAMRRIAASRGSAPQFLHGIATGDPTDRSVIFWTRVTLSARASAEVILEVFADPQAQQLVARTTHVTTAQRDFTVKIDQGGLKPATTYYYRFLCEGTPSVMGRTRTAPGATSDARQGVRFGVVSCSSIPHGFFNAYRFMGQRHDLDAIIHLGDYIYEYADGDYGSVRSVLPRHEITTLDDYRTRHAFYKQDPDLMELHRQFPFITIWDDHESTDNAYEEGTTGNTGLPNTPFGERINSARRAYD